MTGKQRLFIEYYFGTARGNASEAARLAGYADPENEGYRLKKHPEVWKQLEQRLSERTMASAEVLELLTQHAAGSLEPFLSIDSDGVSFDLSTPQAQANLHLIRKVKTKRRTGGKKDERWEEIETEIELHDAQAAVALLGRYWKLFSDRQIHEGEADKPVVVKVLNGVRMADLRT